MQGAVFAALQKNCFNMRRIILLLAVLVWVCPLYGQYAWRFSPSYTFDAPAFSKADLASRADDYRRYAEFQLNAPDIYQYDTKHHTSWYLYSEEFSVNKKKVGIIIHMYVAILPENGKYTAIVERCEASARIGRKAIFEFEILRSDDTVYKDRMTKAAVSQIKAFVNEQFDSLIPKIREIMENPIDRFQLDEITPTTYCFSTPAPRDS